MPIIAATPPASASVPPSRAPARGGVEPGSFAAEVARAEAPRDDSRDSTEADAPIRTDAPATGARAPRRSDDDGRAPDEAAEPETVRADAIAVMLSTQGASVPSPVVAAFGGPDAIAPATGVASVPAIDGAPIPAAGPDGLATESETGASAPAAVSSAATPDAAAAAPAGLTRLTGILLPAAAGAPSVDGDAEADVGDGDAPAATDAGADAAGTPGVVASHGAGDDAPQDDPASPADGEADAFLAPEAASDGASDQADAPAAQARPVDRAAPDVAAPPKTALPAAGAAVVAAVASGIEAAAGSRKTRFEIRLDPAELGRVDVRLDIGHDGRLSTRLIVERPETLDLLRQDQRELTRSLEQAGFQLGSGGLAFQLRDGRQAWGGPAEMPEAGAPAAIASDIDAASAAYRAPRAAGGLDVHA